MVQYAHVLMLVLCSSPQGVTSQLVYLDHCERIKQAVDKTNGLRYCRVDCISPNEGTNR